MHFEKKSIMHALIIQRGSFSSQEMQKRCEMLTSARAQVNGLMSLNRKLAMSSGRPAAHRLVGLIGSAHLHF